MRWSSRGKIGNDNFLGTDRAGRVVRVAANLIHLADVEVLAVIRREERNTRWLLQPREKDFRLSELALGCKEREAVDSALARGADDEIVLIIEGHEARTAESGGDDRDGVTRRDSQRQP